VGLETRRETFAPTGCGKRPAKCSVKKKKMIKEENAAVQNEQATARWKQREGTINYRLPARLSSRIPHMTCSGRRAATAPRIVSIRSRWAHDGSDSPLMTSPTTVYAYRTPNTVPWRGLTPVSPPLRPHFTDDDRSDYTTEYTASTHVHLILTHQPRETSEWKIFAQCEHGLIFLDSFLPALPSPSGRYTDTDRLREGE